LIVEDDPNSRWVLCALLKRLGYDCCVATNGQEALDMVEDFGPQAILMDIMMPVLDGLEATTRLKANARTRGIPILALTGNVTPSGISAAQEAGCDDLLAKPIVLQDLITRLQRHLEHDATGIHE
jgi:CheY-like chemotaxis protein